MFGMFGTAKIKAVCLADTLSPMKKYSSIDINRLENKENFDLQEETYEVLSNAVGVQKRYHSFEMICCTWLALIKATQNLPNHSLAGRANTLEQGLRAFLSENADITTRNGMPRGLHRLLEKYL